MVQIRREHSAVKKSNNFVEMVSQRHKMVSLNYFIKANECVSTRTSYSDPVISKYMCSLVLYVSGLDNCLVLTLEKKLNVKALSDITL
jgi:hypothetical protein